MNKKIKILVADDEPEIRKIVSIALENEGYEPIGAADGGRAIELLRADADIDLIILDIMMPGQNGIATAKMVREFSKAPILFLTAFSQENWMKQAYMSGGDDFLAKPFSQSELLLKVNSLLRRYRIYMGKSSLTDEIRLDAAARKICCGELGAELTETEYMIAAFLLKNREKTMRIEDIYEHVWGERFLPADANTVMVHIMKLRRKTAGLRENPIIRTVWGKGYMID